MNMTRPGVLYISCGPPGSGKSTFLNDMKDTNELIISRDEIRFSLLKPGEDYFAHEKEAYNKFINLISVNIKNGINVYADATHLNQKSRFFVVNKLKQKGCYPSEVNAIYFKVPLKTCLERNEMRKGTKTYVPVDQLEKMYCSYELPAHFEGFVHIWEVNEEGDVVEVEK